MENDNHSVPVMEGVRRVCSTQSEVRVFSHGPEKWHYLSCPIVKLRPDSPPDWVRRQKANVREALERISRAKWVDKTSYNEVLNELKKEGGLVCHI